MPLAGPLRRAGSRAGGGRRRRPGRAARRSRGSSPGRFSRRAAGRGARRGSRLRPARRAPRRCARRRRRSRPRADRPGGRSGRGRRPSSRRGGSRGTRADRPSRERIARSGGVHACPGLHAERRLGPRGRQHGGCRAEKAGAREDGRRAGRLPPPGRSPPVRARGEVGDEEETGGEARQERDLEEAHVGARLAGHEQAGERGACCAGDRVDGPTRERRVERAREEQHDGEKSEEEARKPAFGGDIEQRVRGAVRHRDRPVALRERRGELRTGNPRGRRPRAARRRSFRTPCART